MHCHIYFHANNNMKLFLFTAFCITLAHAQYPGQPGGRPPPPGKRFRDPLEVKKIIIGCDLDKSGELSTDEVAKCVRMSFFLNKYASFMIHNCILLL